MNKNFFDELDKDWGDVIGDTYEKSNSFIAEFSQNLDGYGVVEEYKYYEEEIAGTVTIPEGVHIIDTAAFQGCPRITSVNFPDTLMRINRYSFMDCDILENLNFRNGPKIIEENAFSDCKNLKNINFPDTLREIYPNAFGRCGLEGDLIIPDSVVILRDSAFIGCKNLNGTLTIGNNVVEIGDTVFANCEFTGELKIPESVERVGRFVFSGCKFSTIYVRRGNEYNWHENWNYGCDAKIEYY